MLRYGLDVGTNSLGWCVFETYDDVPTRLLAAGSRIFTDGRDPQKKEPLAVTCRTMRGARVRRDRLIQRKKDLLRRLIELGLMPASESERQALKCLDPWELRNKAICEKLSPYELGRVVMHLAQRRGFKSNRKTDKKPQKKEDKDFASALETMTHALQNSGMTLGQYLFQERLQKGLCARGRANSGLRQLRQHYEAEFDAIRDKQAPFFPQLRLEEDWGTPQNVRNSLRDILFFQRPLREQDVGWCQLYFEEKEKRAPRALPSFQKFRIVQNIANLQVISADKKTKRALTPNERDILNEGMQKQKAMSFNKMRTLLKLTEGETFNFETEQRENMEGNETAALMGNKKYFDKAWFGFDATTQDKIVQYFLGTNDSEETIEAKALNEWKLSPEQAKNLAALTPDDFPQGYARFSRRALCDLLEITMNQGLTTTDAIAQIRGHYGHNAQRRDHLPYYGEVMPESMIPSPKRGDKNTQKYGKINNPTVHIGLNQIRRLVNELIDRFGAPDHIVIELARDLKLTKDAKAELEKFRAKNEKLNSEARDKMLELGIAPSDDNIKRYKLWLELSGDVNNRKCPYSGKTISITNLWSDAVEVEHILPESLTFDRSMKNLTIAFRDANRIKGNRAPDEAFNCPGSSYDYDDILERVKNATMSPGKKRKFYPDAMKAFRESEDGFIARQLTDTQYLSKVARRYLQSVCEKVDVIPGQLTARIRHEWGLNSILTPEGAEGEQHATKCRNDHRHHAIDAIVIACTDRSMLMKASKASGRDGRDWSVHFPTPWDQDQFRRDVAAVIGSAVVSHKPDHGIQGRLHEETNYGVIAHPSEYERNSKFNVVYRSDFRGHFANVTPDKLSKKLELIRDPLIRDEITSVLTGADSKEDIAKKINDYAQRKGIRRIRLLKKEATIEPIHHRDAAGREFHKGVVPGSNHHVAFWKMPDGTVNAAGCSYLEANRTRDDMNQLKPHPAAKLICRIHNGDLIAADVDAQRKIFRVVNLSPANKTFWCVEHHEGGNLSQRYKEGDLKYFFLRFSKMDSYKIRKIYISPTGVIYDHGSMF